MPEHQLKTVETPELRIAYVEYGAAEGWPVVLSHGFPYDVHAFSDVAAILVRAGAGSSFHEISGQRAPQD